MGTAEKDVYPWGKMVPGAGKCVTCGRSIPVDFLMCAPHWRKVSGRTKALLNRALMDWQMGHGTLGTVRDLQEQAWRDVEHG